jgi:hypothetical protein
MPEPRGPRRCSRQERASALRPRDRSRRPSRTRSAAVAPRGPFFRLDVSTAATQSASDMATEIPLEASSRSRSERAMRSLLPRLWARNRPDHTHRRTVSVERPATAAAAVTSSSSAAERGMASILLHQLSGVVEVAPHDRSRPREFRTVGVSGAHPRDCFGTVGVRRAEYDPGDASEPPALPTCPQFCTIEAWQRRFRLRKPEPT